MASNSSSSNSFPTRFQQQQQQQQQPQGRKVYTRFGNRAEQSQYQPQPATQLRPPATQFETHEDIEFARIENSSYRISALTIEQEPYVAVAHWWFNKEQATWYPSRKQIYLPKAAWFGLLGAIDRISEVIEPIPGRQAGSQGSPETRSFFFFFFYSICSNLFAQNRDSLKIFFVIK